MSVTIQYNIGRGTAARSRDAREKRMLNGRDDGFEKARAQNEKENRYLSSLVSKTQCNLELTLFRSVGRVCTVTLQ